MTAPVAGRVLLVEDEAAPREMLTEVLIDAGHEVKACANGHAALLALRDGSFDLVLSDIGMPDMGGLDLLRAIRGLDQDLPVVLLTGGPTLESTVEAIELGVLQYLIKPVSGDRLREVVARAVSLGTLARLKREALLTTGSDRQIGERVQLESSFQRGLEGIWMAYQPIVRAVDGQLHGYEALLRTSEPVFPNPGALLAAGEELGRLAGLGAAVRGAVAGLLGSGALPGGVFVNLHPLDLVDDQLLSPAAPLTAFASRVVLEITERASLHGMADIAERIRRLRELGYRIAIDDLGAGYSGLNSLAALAPDLVKFDMALIRGLDHNVVKRKLVVSMAAVCRDLGITVVAEGIETEGERNAAAEAGCDLLQGYLLGRPARLEPSPEGRA